MDKLEYSEKLGRQIRRGDLKDIGVSTLTKAIKAIDEGDNEKARRLVDYLFYEGKGLHDLYADWCWSWYTYIAKKYGEQAIYEASTETQKPWLYPFYRLFRNFTPKERVEFLVEHMRSHRCGEKQMGDVKVIEEKDRYIIEFDPCGSGGRMRRGDPVDKTPPRTEPPYNFYMMKRAYPWTWSKKGVSAYCVHCCINEILPIEWGGYPLWITDYQDDSNKPCRWYVYKKDELIPEEYFTRIGKKRPKIR